MTFSLRSPHFQCAFVAMSYFWGARGDQLAEAFAPLALQEEAASLLSDLNQPGRPERAAALSAELAKLSAALDQRGLARC